MGRPTKYKTEFVQKVDEYLALCVDVEYDWTKSVTEGKGLSGESWEHRTKVKLPTREGFSTFIDIDMGTLEDWEHLYPDFCRALGKIKKEQQDRLIEKGLSGDYNPTIAKLILSANHGMKEKTETDITSKGESIGGFNFTRNGAKNKK